jgi:mono/diheme cytochrome c family protein
MAGFLLMAVLPLAGQTQQQKLKKQHSPSPSSANSAQADRGQVVFEQNCSRCHNAPEGFSPRISQTIAMHMRTRANLSEADYKALLRFFNP